MQTQKIKPYNDYNSYLRSRYGTKVYRIGLDAGFTCPNRDGSKGSGGCLYCAGGSRSAYADPKKTIAEQTSLRIAYLKDKYAAKKFIAYFQAFTNTYAPIEKLKETYDSVLGFDGIVGISIGTRPDCVDKNRIDLISSYSDRYEVWIEYGMQSVRDEALTYLGRGHTFEEFVEAVKLSKGSGVRVCAHVIFGLPGETEEDVARTAELFSDIGIDGVKIHLLHVLRGSRAEKLYAEGSIKLLARDAYVRLVCDFLERLSPDTVIQRMTAQGALAEHIAPEWALDKTGTIGAIEDELIRRKTRQGSLYKKLNTAIS
jgi:radical SAM protein (TIGR01212 family)